MLLICDPVSETHFVFVPGGVLIAENPLRAFATHWALLQALTLSWEEIVIFRNTMSEVGSVAPASLTWTKALPLRAAAWRLCTLSPLKTHLSVSPTKSEVRTGVCPG